MRNNLVVTIVVLCSTLGLICQVSKTVKDLNAPQSNLLKLPIFQNAVIIESDYKPPYWRHRSYWEGWIKQKPEELEKKIKTGIWQYSFFREFHRGGEHYLEFREFQKRHPNVTEDDILVLDHYGANSEMEITCLATKTGEESFIWAVGFK